MLVIILFHHYQCLYAIYRCRRWLCRVHQPIHVNPCQEALTPTWLDSTEALLVVSWYHLHLYVMIEFLSRIQHNNLAAVPQPIDTNKCNYLLGQANMSIGFSQTTMQYMHNIIVGLEIFFSPVLLITLHEDMAILGKKIVSTIQYAQLGLVKKFFPVKIPSLAVCIAIINNQVGQKKINYTLSTPANGNAYGVNTVSYRSQANFKTDMHSSYYNLAIQSNQMAVHRNTCTHIFTLSKTIQITHYISVAGPRASNYMSMCMHAQYNSLQGE